MISVHELTKSFGSKQVLNCRSMHFRHELVHGIIGLNGAGKTTFFNILSGFLSANTGVVLNNESPLRREDVAYLESESFFYSYLTGEEYLSIFPRTNRDFNVGRMTDLMKLPLRDLTETYSSGMRKKLALLAILRQDKPIYLLDEPFNGLDLETNQILRLIIQRLVRKGKTIFMSSHILAPLTDLCNEIHLLHNGVFTKTYDAASFHAIETDLFAGSDKSITQILDSSL